MGRGYKLDVDIDYQSDKRQEVKAYTERRYNTVNESGETTCYRVLSAGTMTTLKAKAVIKDVARTMRLPVGIVNYITAMINDDKADWTELFRMAKQNKKLADFIEKYPKLFEDIRSLMFAPRSSSIHASALIITPKEKDGKPYECFDFIPIKKVDNLLVSENSGVELDELGLLKNDCLATKELSILKEKCDLVNSAYGTDYTFDKLMLMEPDDPEVFEMLSLGATQSVFQFSSKGITNMLKELHPTCIEDIIASNALYRPATLDSGCVDDFINRHNGLAPTKYYWGTEEILKNTFGILTYQEQLSQVAQKVGKFSVSHSIQLVKYISKKKKDKIQAARSEFIEGALSQGCPEEDASAIWDVFEAAGRYCFNRCIRGTEKIKYHDLTIQEMFLLGSKYGTGISLDYDSKKFVINDIVDIRYMGYRDVYRITLESGETIDVTDNHKHPTTNGIKRTDELVVGKDMMYVFDKFHSRTSTVVSVEYICKDNVYDVEMDHPFHSFCIENGIVTCNSHSTAYALTAYWGAWLKCKYPVATYTVALKWANDDKELQAIMSEMEQYSAAKLVQPDINRSVLDFSADFEKGEILWSLTRIKLCTPKSMGWVLEERDKHGQFTSIENFIDRVHKYKLKNYQYWDDPDNEEEARRCPINARHILNLILAGCFDILEEVREVTERYLIVDRAAKKLGIELKEKDFPVDLICKHYFWSQQQQRVSGLGAIDYRRIYSTSKLKELVRNRYPYKSFPEILDEKYRDKKVVICCTVADVIVKKYTSSKTGQKENFAKLILQQGTDISEMLAWSEEYTTFQEAIDNAKGKIVCFTAMVKYSEFNAKNELQLTRQSYFETI